MESINARIKLLCLAFMFLLLSGVQAEALEVTGGSGGSIYQKYSKMYRQGVFPEKMPEVPVEARPERIQRSQNFVDKFEENMANMDPENIVIFEIAAGERKAFVYPLKAADAKIIGAYSVSGGETNKISFSIFFPNGTFAISRSNKKEAVFAMNTDVAGDYTLEFINRNVIFSNNKRVNSIFRRRQ